MCACRTESYIVLRLIAVLGGPDLQPDARGDAQCLRQCEDEKQREAGKRAPERVVVVAEHVDTDAAQYTLLQQPQPHKLRRRAIS